MREKKEGVMEKERKSVRRREGVIGNWTDRQIDIKYHLNSPDFLHL